MTEGRILLGLVLAPFGVKGALRIRSFTAEPKDIAGYGPLFDESGERRFEIALLGERKGVVRARLSGVEDRDAALALTGEKLYLPRSALPQTKGEEYYHADLLGLAAELGDGRTLGRVSAVYDFGAGALIEVSRGGKAPLLVPFTRAVVPLVDLERGRLVVDPPPGLLAEEKAEEKPA